MDAFNDFNNPQVAGLPSHLKQYIVPQHYQRYTPQDHAIWRYVMRQNYSYLKDIAYYPYIKGLKRAGLSIEYIPDLQTMNDHLAKIGWGAVTVDGFIPPVAFMEYQSYHVLVIAADIRQIHHIAYTPAPDIIHESAGHAPIIADEDYNKYLSYFGTIGAKAMFSSKDHELYEAIRTLSILKELPNADLFAIRKAEQKAIFCQDNLGDPSEMALLSRLHWWTVEYGLIGTLENPKIYGAGLLSSIRESVTCMQTEIKKLWYDIDTVNYAYDITKPQPQLFVTPDFKNLIDVLEAFADTMAFKTGGSEGIFKAIECRQIATAVYSSGLKVSGVFTDLTISKNDDVTFIKTTGPTALSFNNLQLEGHDKHYHKDGFSSPVGLLKDTNKPLENFSEEELEKLGLLLGEIVNLNFQSGITLTGKVNSIIKRDKKIILISFKDCLVVDSKHQILFDPSWGIYDMAVGEKIVSVFCGVADKEAFDEIIKISAIQTKKAEYDKLTRELHLLYAQVRKIRETNEEDVSYQAIFEALKTNHREDWLCALEVLEILEQHGIKNDLVKEIRIYLEMKASNDDEVYKLIHDGIKLIRNPVTQLIIEE